MDRHEFKSPDAFIGRDADIFRSRLDWEQFRLEQWAEKAHLQDPTKADLLVNWKLVNETLEHLKILTTDTQVLKEKYDLELVDDQPPSYDESQTTNGEERETASVNRFKRLFGSNNKFVYNSSAAAKVIQAKNSYTKKLRWASVDKRNMERLIGDIGNFVGQLHSMLDSNIQVEMSKNIQFLLQEATNRYGNLPDLEYLKELVAEMKQTRSTGATVLDTENLDEEIARNFARLLHQAVKKNEVKDATQLLDKGLSPNVEDRIGWSPMINAAEAGHIPMMKLLLERGADPLKGTIGFRLPMHFAAENGHVDAVRLLLDQPNVDPNARDRDGRTAIFNAADKGHTAVVKLLLEQSSIEPSPINESGFSPLLQSIFGHHIEIIRLFLARDDVDANKPDGSYNQTPLWMCASYKEGEIVRMFLERHDRRKDISLDAQSTYGETALGRCARQGYKAASQLLIAAGAKINKVNDDMQSPLSSAAAEGQEEMLEILLGQPQIEVDSIDNKGRTALHRACEADRTKCVKLLLAQEEHAPKIELLDIDGNTALHLAAAKGNKIPAKMLLRHQQLQKEQKNVDIINVQNKKGNTALALAAVEGNSDRNEAVVRLLLENGADPAVEDEDLETPFEKARDRHLDGIVGVFKEVLKM